MLWERENDIIESRTTENSRVFSRRQVSLGKAGWNMKNEYVTFTIGKKKNIALIAHDNEKPKLIQWCKDNYDILKQHNLYGTGTTSRLIADKAGLCLSLIHI